MASVEKFTDEAVSNQLRHNDRKIKKNSNKDIDPSRSGSNSSFPLDHGSLTDFEYYQKRVGETYLYGRGTAREKKAVTACGWIVTLPKEITGIPEKEEAFFKGVLDFISHRYGKENIISNSIHRDEGGQPHIHVIFVPVTSLDHDQIRFKTTKTKSAVRTESGRYEFSYRYKLDANGEKIPVKNYAKMSDYFDEKISCAEVLNRAELQHFHSDLQTYLFKNGIDGKVVTGTTGGVNFSVEELKEFTQKTGLTLDQIKEIQRDRSILETVKELNTRTLTAEKEVKNLSGMLTLKEHELQFVNKQNKTLVARLTEVNKELQVAKKGIENLHNMQHTKDQEKTWGNTSGWGSPSGWGKSGKDITQEEKLW